MMAAAPTSTAMHLTMEAAAAAAGILFSSSLSSSSSRSSSPLMKSSVTAVVVTAGKDPDSPTPDFPCDVSPDCTLLRGQPSMIGRMLLTETSVDPRDAATLLPGNLFSSHSMDKVTTNNSVMTKSQPPGRTSSTGGLKEQQPACTTARAQSVSTAAAVAGAGRDQQTAQQPQQLSAGHAASSWHVRQLPPGKGPGAKRPQHSTRPATIAMADAAAAASSCKQICKQQSPSPVQHPGSSVDSSCSIQGSKRLSSYPPTKSKRSGASSRRVGSKGRGSGGTGSAKVGSASVSRSSTLAPSSMPPTPIRTVSLVEAHKAALEQQSHHGQQQDKALQQQQQPRSTAETCAPAAQSLPTAAPAAAPSAVVDGSSAATRPPPTAAAAVPLSQAGSPQGQLSDFTAMSAAAVSTTTAQQAAPTTGISGVTPQPRPAAAGAAPSTRQHPDASRKAACSKPTRRVQQKSNKWQQQKPAGSSGSRSRGIAAAHRGQVTAPPPPPPPPSYVLPARQQYMMPHPAPHVLPVLASSPMQQAIHYQPSGPPIMLCQQYIGRLGFGTVAPPIITAAAPVVKQYKPVPPLRQSPAQQDPTVAAGAAADRTNSHVSCDSHNKHQQGRQQMPSLPASDVALATAAVSSQSKSTTGPCQSMQHAAGAPAHPTAAAAATAPTAAAGSSVSNASSVMRWCHVLHARHESPALAAPLVKELVAAQIRAAQPVRAPWYRHGSRASIRNSRGTGSRHTTEAEEGNIEVALDCGKESDDSSRLQQQQQQCQEGTQLSGNTRSDAASDQLVAAAGTIASAAIAAAVAQPIRCSKSLNPLAASFISTSATGAPAAADRASGPTAAHGDAAASEAVDRGSRGAAAAVAAATSTGVFLPPHLRQ